MSHPVSFKDFGSDNETLYREYCFVHLYREANLYLRSITDGDVRAGAHGRGGRGAVGGDRGGVAGRGGVWRSDAAQRREAVAGGSSDAVKLSLPWRAGALGGGGSSALAGAEQSSGAVGEVAGGGDRADGSAVGGGSVGAGAVGSVDGSAVRQDADAPAVDSGSRLPDGGNGADSIVVKHGKNYEKNKAKRMRAKALRDARNVPDRGKSLVSVRAAHPQLDETWAERKVRENKVAIAKLDAQLEKIEKEKRDGTAEKRYQVEANLVQGQLDGAFALVPQQRVVSWAKTINSDSSGSKSSGKKTVASIPSLSSGLGSASATSVTASERQLTEEVAKLRKRLAASDADWKKKIEKVEEVELKKRMDLSNGIERRLMFLEDEVRRRDKLVATYKSIAGIRE